MVDEIGKMIINHMDRYYPSGMLLQLLRSGPAFRCKGHLFDAWALQIHLISIHMRLMLLSLVLCCIFLLFLFSFFVPFLEALPLLLFMFSYLFLPCNYLDITVSLNATF